MHTDIINGMPIATGDIICTRDGTDNSLLGKVWQTLGLFVPGKIDHTLIYVGPKGTFIEAGARGVIRFEMPDETWDAEQVAGERLLYDSLVGVAYPLHNLNFSASEESEIREKVAAFCVDQLGKPYNVNFFAPDLDAAFYCSQLVYRAYLEQGIEIIRKPEIGIQLEVPFIVTPQMLWDGCFHQSVKAKE